MSRINTNVASLIARRAIGINYESPNEALERLCPGLRINRGKDDPVGPIADLQSRLEGFQKNVLVTPETVLQVARENVAAAESAIQDADFAIVASNLTRAQLLVDKVSRLRAGDRPDKQTDDQPVGCSAECGGVRDTSGGGHS